MISCQLTASKTIYQTKVIDCKEISNLTNFDIEVVISIVTSHLSKRGFLKKSGYYEKLSSLTIRCNKNHNRLLGRYNDLIYKTIDIYVENDKELAAIVLAHELIHWASIELSIEESDKHIYPYYGNCADFQEKRRGLMCNILSEIQLLFKT
jgi:hypothetical protein